MMRSTAGTNKRRQWNAVPPGLVIPAACTVAAQIMQHVYATAFKADDLTSYALSSPLMMFSFIKVVAVVVLATHFARVLVGGNSTQGTATTAHAERHLSHLIAINIGFALFLILAIRFINSPGFSTLLDMGVTKTAAKALLALTVLLLIRPFNKRVFRDTSLAIGSDVVLNNKRLLPTNANGLFMKYAMHNCLKYLLPVYVLHVLLTKGSSRFEDLLLLRAALDSVLVVVLGLLAGYAIFKSHDQVLSSHG